MWMYLSCCKTCVKYQVVYCTLESKEQKPPLGSQASSLIGHNRFGKNMTKTRLCIIRKIGCEYVNVSLIL